jgi:hypothetical protein
MAASCITCCGSWRRRRLRKPRSAPRFGFPASQQQGRAKEERRKPLFLLGAADSRRWRRRRVASALLRMPRLLVRGCRVARNGPTSGRPGGREAQFPGRVATACGTALGASSRRRQHHPGSTGGSAMSGVPKSDADGDSFIKGSSMPLPAIGARRTASAHSPMPHSRRPTSRNARWPAAFTQGSPSPQKAGLRRCSHPRAMPRAAGTGRCLASP